MNRITILLCALVNQFTSQTTGESLFNVAEVVPAKILAQQKTLSENSDLYVTCSTFGFKGPMMVFVYLCKGDVCIHKRMQKPHQNDTTFIIHSVGIHHSGNYSCVYSTRNYTLSKVTKRGQNVIQILVISNVLPADISISGPSTVSEGEIAAFRCTISHTLQTLGKCQLIHSYLKRNETIIQVRAFNVTRMEATFTIEGAAMRDSGHYSCVLLPSRCIQEHETALHGNNAVVLEVQGSLVLVIVCRGMITLMLLGLCLGLGLGLGLVWIAKHKRMVGGKSKAGHTASYNPGVASLQANAEMVEEQQMQTEGEDLDSQNGDSWSIEEDEVYESVSGGHLSSDVSIPVYATSSRCNRKTHPELT